SCGDGIVQTSDGETCDDGNAVSGCDPLHPAQALDDCLNSCRTPICEDPARITLSRDPNQVKVHGRLISNTPVDFLNEHFVVQLSTGGDVVCRASLLGGSMTAQTATVWKFKNPTARDAGGFYNVKIIGR